MRRQVDGNAQWPAGARQEFKSAMLKYYIIMERFGLRLTEALCAGVLRWRIATCIWCRTVFVPTLPGSVQSFTCALHALCP